MPSLTFELSRDEPDDCELVAVPVCSDRLDLVADHVDVAFLAERGFEGKPGEVLATPGPAGATVLAVGLGPSAGVGPAVLRLAAGAAARAASRNRAVTLRLLDAVPDDGDAAACTRAVVEGFGLGSYRFTRHKTDPRPTSAEHVTLIGSTAKKMQHALAVGAAVVAAESWARDLVNEPAGSLSPRDLAQQAIEMAERTGLRCSVLDEVDIEASQLGGLMGVARGSAEPARLVQLTWDPPKARGTIVLVGKGITFDSGGLSLKTTAGMMQMKTDMGGAAAVLAAMSTMPVIAPKCRVVAIVPMTENMPSGTAVKPGDVLTIRNGKTVEVVNTDAEGRLILADGLSLAVEEQADAIIDVATLTGACGIALGPDIAGLMSNHDGLAEMVATAADRAGESVWRLPLPAGYERLIEGEIADLRNQGKGGKGGALTAGLFLQHFVGDTPWVHLDIASPARSEEETPLVTVGGTGFATRTLIEAVAAFRVGIVR